MQRSLLELYDADGTVTEEIDVLAALEGKGSAEVQHYIIGAAEFVAAQTKLPLTEVYEGVKGAIIGIFPNRTEAKYWATFPASDKQMVPVAPAVDHFFLVEHGVRNFLERRLAVEVDEGMRARIEEFLRSKCGNALFGAGNAAALPYARMDEDAIVALEGRLRNDALMTIFTNSSPTKAVTLLERAGFGGHIEIDGVRRGKIGAIGNAQKWLVDSSIKPSSQTHLDLSAYGLSVPIDLRRSAYRERVEILMAAAGVKDVLMATDIPELDSYSLASWYGVNAHHGMRINPTSAPQSIEAARHVLHAVVSNKLSEVIAGL